MDANEQRARELLARAYEIEADKLGAGYADELRSSAFHIRSGNVDNYPEYRFGLRAIMAALAQQVPADGEWVPKVPTEAMIQVGYEAMRTNNVRDTSEQGRIRRIYAAMLAATPQAPQPTTDSVANRYESVAPQAPQPESREARMVVVERDANDVPTVWCDPEIADLVTALNAGGIRTIASCSGHGEQNGNIALADGRELIIAPDYESARRLEALALSMAAASQPQQGADDARLLACAREYWDTLSGSYEQEKALFALADYALDKAAALAAHGKGG